MDTTYPFRKFALRSTTKWVGILPCFASNEDNLRAKESSTAALTKGRSRLPSLTVFGTGISLAMCFGVAASAQLLPFRGIEPVVVFDVKMAIEGEGWRIGFQDDHGFYLDPYITGGQLDEDSWEFF